EEIYGQFHVLAAAEQTLRHASNAFMGLEMTLVRMACIGRVQPLQTILEHLQHLETGAPAVSALAALQPASPAATRAGSVPNGQVAGVQTAGEAAAVLKAAPVSGVVSQALVSETSQSAAPTTAEGLWEALQQRITERRPSFAGPMQHGRPRLLDE